MSREETASMRKAQQAVLKMLGVESTLFKSVVSVKLEVRCDEYPILTVEYELPQIEDDELKRTQETYWLVPKE